MFWFERLHYNSLFSDTPYSVQTENHNLPARIVEGPAPFPQQDHDLQRSWNEFTTGMQMLHKHWQRMNARADKIACANMQLLHNNLRSTAQYKHVLSNLKQQRQNHSLIYHWPLLENDHAGCCIIGLSKNTQQAVNANHRLSDFVFPYINNNHSGFGKEQSTCMYLVISGKLLVSRNTSVTTSIQRDHPEKTYSITSYKTGDVLLVQGEEKQKIIDIRTNQKHTRIFSVHFSESL